MMMMEEENEEQRRKSVTGIGLTSTSEHCAVQL